MDKSAAYWALVLIYAEMILSAIQAVLFYQYRCHLCPIHGIERVR